MVDIVALDKRVGGHARSAVASDVHPFALGLARGAQAGVMDVVSADDEGVTVAAVHRQGIVARFCDFTILEGDVMASDKAHAGTAASKP